MFETIENEEGTVKLVGEATVHEATLVWETLCQATKERQDLALDLSGLTAVDTAGAQLLLAVRRSGAVARVHSCPESVRRFLESIGVEDKVL